MATDEPTFPGEQILLLNGPGVTLTSSGCTNPGNAVDNDPSTYASFIQEPQLVTEQIFITQTSTFTIPSDFVSLTSVEAIGGGGNGARVATKIGGGGGAYSYTNNVPGLVPGQSISCIVGIGGVGDGGDTQFKDGSTLLAKGGKSGDNGGQGGQSSLGVGTTLFSGGDGGTTDFINSAAGGGGAGGPHGDGGDGGNAVGVNRGGGGGNGGGANGSNAPSSGTTGGHGGNNFLGAGGGAGGTGSGSGVSGINGGGGGGGGSSEGQGGDGGDGTEWDATHGSGGGSGGGGGSVTINPAVLSNTPVYFNGGTSYPAGTYRVSQAGGAWSYNGPRWSSSCTLTSAASLLSVSAASYSGSTITITTSIAHGLSNGQAIVVSGLYDNSTGFHFTGPQTVASIISTTKFTYTVTSGLALTVFTAKIDTSPLGMMPNYAGNVGFYATEAAAEAAAVGGFITINHPGGPIGAYGIDTNYADNAEGTTHYAITLSGDMLGQGGLYGGGGGAIDGSNPNFPGLGSPGLIVFTYQSLQPIVPRYIRAEWGFNALITRVRLKQEIPGNTLSNTGIDFDSALGYIEGELPPPIDIPFQAYIPLPVDNQTHELVIEPPVYARGIVIYPDAYSPNTGQYPEVDLYQLQVYELDLQENIMGTQPTVNIVRVGAQAVTLYPWVAGSSYPFPAGSACNLYGIKGVDLSITTKEARLTGGESVHQLGAWETDREYMAKITSAKCTLEEFSYIFGGTLTVDLANGNGPEVQYITPGLTDRAPYVTAVIQGTNGTPNELFILPYCKVTGTVSRNLQRDTVTDVGIDLIAIWDTTYICTNGQVGGIFEDLFSNSATTANPPLHS